MENRNCFRENDRREAVTCRSLQLWPPYIVTSLSAYLTLNQNVKLMSGSGTNKIADYGDGSFQILFFSLFAALSELYSRVDVS